MMEELYNRITKEDVKAIENDWKEIGRDLQKATGQKLNNKFIKQFRGMEDQFKIPDSKNMDVANVMLGNIQDYKRFIHKCAMENLKLSDKIIYYCSRWNGLLYKAVYELRLKDVIKTKITTLKVKEYYLKTLLYVRVYNKVYWYDNQREKVKFKKWVKAK